MDCYELRIFIKGTNNDGPRYGLSREVLIEAVDFSNDEIMNFVTNMLNEVSIDKIYDFLLKMIEMINEDIIVATEEVINAIFLYLHELEINGT